MVKTRLKFDKHGVCYKCGSSVSRLESLKTWHHDDINDYHRCGFVKVRRNISKINSEKADEKK